MVERAQRSVAAIRLEKKIIKQAGTHQKCKRKSSGQAGTATFNSFWISWKYYKSHGKAKNCSLDKFGYVLKLATPGITAEFDQWFSLAACHN